MYILSEDGSKILLEDGSGYIIEEESDTLVAKNFNTSMNEMLNTYLASLPTPNSLWVVLLDEDTASIAVTDAYTDLTRSGSTNAIQRSSLTAANRAIDLGALVFTGTTETPRSIAVLDDNPANAGVNLVAVEDIMTDGSVYNFATQGNLYVDGLTFKIGYQGET